MQLAQLIVIQFQTEPGRARDFYAAIDDRS